MGINGGTMTLNNTPVSTNIAERGGGIFSGSEGGTASITLNNSPVSGNTASKGVGGLANGTYAWRVKHPKYLANSGSVTLTGAPTTSVEMGLMRGGDADNDNMVNISDLNILKNSFGRRIGEPGYDDRADFTGDERVNSSDFILLKLNFGQSGAPPIHPGN